MYNPASKPVTIILLLLMLVCFLYAVFEISQLRNQTTGSEPEEQIESSLSHSQELFRSIYEEFSEQTIELKHRIEQRFNQQISRQIAWQEMASYPFWGTALYRNGDFFVWNEFALTSIPEPEQYTDDALYVEVKRHNNVTFLEGRISFTISDDDQFTLITSRRLKQRNVIPIARQQEVDLAEDTSLQDKFPVRFNFFEPPPASLDHYRKLQTVRSDSVGIVHADRADYEPFVAGLQREQQRWRTLFHLIIFLLGTALFFHWAGTGNSWLQMALQVVTLLTVWILFIQFELPDRWISQFLPDIGSDRLESLSAISYYAIHALFIFFIALSVISTMTRKWNLKSNESHYQTFIYSICFGGLSVFLILFFLLTTMHTAVTAQVPMLRLEFVPDLESFILFIASGLFICSISALLVTFWWHLFTSERDKTVVISLIGFVGFLAVYFISDLFLEPALFEVWIFLLSTIFFLVSIAAAVYIWKYPAAYLQMSGFRILMLAALFTTGTGYTIFYHAHKIEVDQNLLNAAEEFSIEEDEVAREVTRELLTTLERQLSFLTSQDLEERESIVEAQFHQAIESTLAEEWRRFSFEIKLVDSRGEHISDYATNFDSPVTGFYNLLRMQTSYQFERISQATNRPVIQGRPSNITRDDYTTFYRGWIPIYDSQEAGRILAWIVGAVYVERPDFNKPIRAVLAASAAEDWRESYYLAEFENQALIRSTIRGIYADQPIYNRLPDREAEITEQDSLAYLSTLTDQGNFREVLKRASGGTVIKASTPFTSFKSHLFAFFRYNVVLLAAGLLLFPLFSLFGFKGFKLFGRSRRFKDRLLDGLALSTLIFLVVLIIATQYGVNQQNEQNLKREIVTNLDNLTETIRREQVLAEGSTDNITLSGLTTPIDADAIFYTHQVVSGSTTPQIFQQNILPEVLPWPVYDLLYNRQRNHVTRTIEIGGQPLLIGYQLILSETNQPVGVAAIPAFIHSPLFTEQLLETTSYLLAVYLLVFGAFIIAMVLLSSRLTRPIRYLQEGLDKISGGELETTIPVRTEDEFGTLSKAYNRMVEQLKILQKELAEAEREEAWKEMAQQVAHEIKNPLTPMKLNLQHLLRQFDNLNNDDPDLKLKIEHMTGGIIQQIESLNKIASDFSKFARPVHEEFMDIDLNEVALSVVDLYKHEQGGVIETDLTGRSLIIRGSGDELRRTLINLIKNSYEASNNDVSVRLITRRVGDRGIIEVEDDGDGIAEEVREKIFVPNFSTKSSGTGLGLAIAKKIVEAHEGTITFKSNTEKGTTFRIEIPLKEKTAGKK